jgi:type II secretory pathway component PulK
MGRFASAQDIALVLDVGPDDVALILPHVTVNGSGRINVNTASAEALAAIEGITLEAGRTVVDMRERTGPIPSIFAVADELSAVSRDSLFRAASTLSGHLLAEVTALEVRSTGFTEGRAGVTAVALFERRGTEVLIIGRRTE